MKDAMSDPSRAIFISRTGAERVANKVMAAKGTELKVRPYYQRRAMLGYTINVVGGGALTHNETQTYL